MGIAVHISKYKTLNNIIYYKVEGEKSNFVMGIDSSKNLIYVYLNCSSLDLI